MKNKKIIDAWDEIAPSEETENRIFDKIQEKLQKKEKAFNNKNWYLRPSFVAAIILLTVVFMMTVSGYAQEIFRIMMGAKIDIGSSFGYEVVSEEEYIALGGRQYNWLCNFSNFEDRTFYSEKITNSAEFAEKVNNAVRGRVFDIDGNPIDEYCAVLTDDETGRIIFKGAEAYDINGDIIIYVTIYGRGYEYPSYRATIMTEKKIAYHAKNRDSLDYNFDTVKEAEEFIGGKFKLPGYLPAGLELEMPIYANDTTQMELELFTGRKMLYLNYYDETMENLFQILVEPGREKEEQDIVFITKEPEILYINGVEVAKLELFVTDLSISIPPFYGWYYKGFTYRLITDSMHTVGKDIVNMLSEEEIIAIITSMIK